MTLVLLRHGQSEWNQENRFTGWVDVGLSPKGYQEAQQAGELIKAEKLTFDCVYTSVLKRAVQTSWQVLDVLDHVWLPIHCHWELNERHYGALQGMNKLEMVEKYGDAQVQKWRRSYDVLPPSLSVKEQSYSFPYPIIPECESLKLTYERVIPFYESTIVSKLKTDQRVLICAHGNSLRALVKYFDNISDDDIVKHNIPTGIPLVYQLDPDTLTPISSSYLGDPKVVQAALKHVAQQTSVKNST